MFRAVLGGVWAAALALAAGTAAAEAPSLAELESALSREIIGSTKTLEEAQLYLASQVPPLPRLTDAAQWEGLASELRADILDRVVFRGEAAQWRTSPLEVEWQETISGGEGYSIRKLRYEAVPGLWIPALLYVPEPLAPQAPVFLNVNGHEGEGKAVLNKQLRCINLAKRGVLALSPDWLGMGQLRGENFSHYRMNQLDLCGTSGLAVFFLAMQRGLDVLLSLENADPHRVGVAGLSGGGWQTIVLSALDTRVTFANPVAGYSSFLTRVLNYSDLGDSEQTPVDLATVADYHHLTALLAPRQALLTYCANDDCCFRASHALPPLLVQSLPVYRLYGREGNLQAHVNYDPGTHNFDQDNREALYRRVAHAFFPGDADFNTREIPSESEVKSADELAVALPEENADFHSLALAAAASLPRDAALPVDREAAAAWQRQRRDELARITAKKTFRVRAEPAGSQDLPGVAVHAWKLHLSGTWTVPAVELVPADPAGDVILVADGGRAGAAQAVARLLANQNRVLVLDPFYFGECAIAERGFLFALLLSAVGDRPLGLEASQVAAVANWWSRDRTGRGAALVAEGPRASLFALVAAALEPAAVVEVRLSGSLGSLKEVIETNGSVDQTPEYFCFGLLERFDIVSLAALAAPTPVVFTDSTDRARRELAGLAAWYALVGRDHDPLP